MRGTPTFRGRENKAVMESNNAGMTKMDNFLHVPHNLYLRYNSRAQSPLDKPVSYIHKSSYGPPMIIIGFAIKVLHSRPLGQANCYVSSPFCAECVHPNTACSYGCRRNVRTTAQHSEYNGNTTATTQWPETLAGPTMPGMQQA